MRDTDKRLRKTKQKLEINPQRSSVSPASTKSVSPGENLAKHPARKRASSHDSDLSDVSNGSNVGYATRKRLKLSPPHTVQLSPPDSRSDKDEIINNRRMSVRNRNRALLAKIHKVQSPEVINSLIGDITNADPVTIETEKCTKSMNGLSIETFYSIPRKSLNSDASSDCSNSSSSNSEMSSGSKNLPQSFRKQTKLSNSIKSRKKSDNIDSKNPPISDTSLSSNKTNFLPQKNCNNSYRSDSYDTANYFKTNDDVYEFNDDSCTDNPLQENGSSWDHCGPKTPPDLMKMKFRKVHSKRSPVLDEVIEIGDNIIKHDDTIYEIISPTTSKPDARRNNRRNVRNVKVTFKHNDQIISKKIAIGVEHDIKRNIRRSVFSQV